LNGGRERTRSFFNVLSQTKKWNFFSDLTQEKASLPHADGEVTLAGARKN